VDKTIAIICDLLIIVGAIVLIIGVISRLMVKPIMGIEAQAFLQFTQTLLDLESLSSRGRLLSL
jgi:uncharacterized membrane protein YuzA (DUF378 family)